MLVGDQSLQMSDVFIWSHAGVLNESAVPSAVQIARMPWVKQLSRDRIKTPCGRFVPDKRAVELAQVERREVEEDMWEAK